MTSSPERTLPILRIGLFLFMLVWALEKVVRPESYQRIFAGFYGLEFGVVAVLAIGVVQILILLAFVAGLYKTWSYGFVLAMNVVTLIVSYQQILFIYGEQGNLLFAASIPVAATSLVLFLLREHDRWLTVERKTTRTEPA